MSRSLPGFIEGRAQGNIRQRNVFWEVSCSCNGNEDAHGEREEEEESVRAGCMNGRPEGLLRPGSDRGPGGSLRMYP